MRLPFWGWHEWRALDESSSMVLLADILKTLMEQEIIAKQPVEPLSHLLSGAMMRQRCGWPKPTPQMLRRHDENLNEAS